MRGAPRSVLSLCGPTAQGERCHSTLPALPPSSGPTLPSFPPRSPDSDVLRCVCVCFFKKVPELIIFLTISVTLL